MATGASGADAPGPTPTVRPFVVSRRARRARGRRARGRHPSVTVAAANPAAADPDESAEIAPLPKARPKLVTPSPARPRRRPQAAGTARPTTRRCPSPPAPPRDASWPRATTPRVRPQADKATALPNGVALPPLEAPEAVLDVIRAGNIIARTPYKWGGGHGRFQDNGYDCSGSVSYALYYAGLIDGPHTAASSMAYGKPGPGKWISIYANAGHVFMAVAGIRFDTSARAQTGSRWHNEIDGIAAGRTRSATPRASRENRAATRERRRGCARHGTSCEHRCCGAARPS